MAGTRQVLFIQGGGAGAHDEWDDKLFDSLRRELGDGYEIRYPRMPGEEDPSYVRWSAAVRREMAGLQPGAVVAGHSVGGTILVNALAERPPERELGAIVLIAAPFVGAGGWPGDEFELPHDLGARLPHGVPVHVFHGLRDETAPRSHAHLYARAIPQAQLHLLPGRDHQLDNDLTEVAKMISSWVVNEEPVLRPATPNDAGVLAQLHVAAWQWAYRGLVDADYLASLDPVARTPIWAERLASGLARTVVAERAGSVVGFVTFGAGLDADATPAVGQIFAIYIYEAVQGTGVGRALMFHALHALAAEGRAEASLWVLETNTLARNFYERGGWRPDGATQDERVGAARLHEVRYRRPLP